MLFLVQENYLNERINTHLEEAFQFASLVLSSKETYFIFHFSIFSNDLMNNKLIDSDFSSQYIT